MPRFRFCYRQEGRTRYVSHLDIVRAFERAARRAGLRLLYSQGFNPRPKLTFAAPLAVGVSGCREYLDLELEEEREPVEVLEALRSNLPDGLVPVAVRVVADGPSLMSLVDRTRYLAVGPVPEGFDARALQAELAAFLSRGEIVVERRSAKGLKRKNIRPGIYSLRAGINGGKLCFSMELKAGAGNVRPDEVLKALGERLPLVPDDFAVLRTALMSRDNQLLWGGKGDGE